MMKVLFHINENNKWDTVLENVSNMIDVSNEGKDKFKIEVVSNGDAVNALKKEAAVHLKLAIKINELCEAGVVFAACRNSIKKFDILEEELMNCIEIVPAGIVEIAKKQSIGYLYIKP